MGYWALKVEEEEISLYSKNSYKNKYDLGGMSSRLLNSTRIHDICLMCRVHGWRDFNLSNNNLELVPSEIIYK